MPISQEQIKLLESYRDKAVNRRSTLAPFVQLLTFR